MKIDDSIWKINFDKVSLICRVKYVHGNFCSNVISNNKGLLRF